MAVTAGIAVANVYYSQPILAAMARTYQVDTEKAGLIAVLAQTGYGIGLFFLIPIGDMIDRKKLILYLQGGLVISLLAAVFSPNIWVLYASSLLIGAFAVYAQVILPMAASLVQQNRGKVVSQVFTGLLIGILVARVFSGFITTWLGWQYVYGISAILVLGTAILMQADFRSVPNHFSGTYTSLLKSTISQLGRFPLLRRTAATGMLAFGTLSAFWVTLTFHLSGPPFYYPASNIGLFGLVAAASALIAPVFGKRADKGSTFRSLLFSLGITLLGILVVKQFAHSIIAVWLAVILLDVGVQSTQVTNIAIIYSLDHTANSRINTVYMTSYFVGGALGAFAAIKCFQYGGWALATTFMSLLAIITIINVVLGKRHHTLKPSL